MNEFKIPLGRGKKLQEEMTVFASNLKELGLKIGMRVSSRGWCYQLEGFRLINKSEFDLVERSINKCRKVGLLPIDFIAEEEGRRFSGVEHPEDRTPIEYIEGYLKATLECENWYTPDWWDGEKYYIQMLVEKIDLKNLWEPICRQYHVPIATSRGWSSMLQRAEYAKRYQEAEEKGLKCVLLYCGDHDPDGLRISEFLRKNLHDLQLIVWEDGTCGYDPTDLIIDPFGLKYDFIEANNLTWIDNLITGSGKNLADPSHPNYHHVYVQEYLGKIGVRKCEANAILPRPDEAKELCIKAIEKYLGNDALARFAVKRKKVKDEMMEFRERTGLDEVVQNALKLIEEDE